jgi:hypothetical protein
MSPIKLLDVNLLRFTCMALRKMYLPYMAFFYFLLWLSNELSFLLRPSVRFQHLTVLSGE